ncbi:hypothetical protein [Burkholderia sp. S171]|uniref:hypothetical protein n=1 Tax=Burkholderia sp. S171 TaxID=1641860 RepID=UPI00131B8950|nr:hypothetical protein [Burkholderia sp. S171]
MTIDIGRIQALMGVVQHITSIEVPRIRRVHGANLESANGVVRALEAAHTSVFEARSLAAGDPQAWATIDSALRLVEDRLGEAIAEAMAFAEAEIELLAEAARSTKH